jgi:hypothetical protein
MLIDEYEFDLQNSLGECSSASFGVIGRDCGKGSWNNDVTN